MATPARLAAILASLLLACAASPAQPPTAPPPHPPLDELVKEYVRLKLPLPPPDAPLVRIRTVYEDEGAGAMKTGFLLGFQLPPTAPGRDPRYMVGEGWRWNWWIDPATVEPAKPSVTALHDVRMETLDWLYLAMQCRLRGWHELADGAYTRVRESFQNLEADELKAWLVYDLRRCSFDQSMEQIYQPASDRKAILQVLKVRVAEDPGVPSKEDARRIHQLELTLAPQKSKPGTVEALIGDLIEYWEEVDNPSNTRGDEAYWKLIELGFEAVPALIDHLNDDRLSRARFRPFILGTFIPPNDVTVGDLCRRILSGLSAKGDVPLRQNDARDWFARAQKIGEEKWLVDHAIAAGKTRETVSHGGRPGAHFFRVIGAKYPGKIPDLYRAVLKKPPTDSGDYIDEIVASKLSREQKIALFEEGVKYSDHSIRTLEGLARVDKPLFRKHVLAAIQEATARAKMGNKWSPAAFLALIEKSEDRECWDEFGAAARRASYGARMETIRSIGPDFEPDQPDPLRRERLQFLSRFLDDRSSEPDPDEEEWHHTEVRDYAATQLAALFRFPVVREFPPFWSVLHNHDLGPLSRLLMRESVRELAKRELARPMK